MPEVAPAGGGLPPKKSYANNAQASDPAGATFGASNRTMSEVGNYLDVDTRKEALELAGESYDNRGFMGSLNLGPANNPNPMRGVTASQKAIFNGPKTQAEYERMGSAYADQYYNPRDASDSRYNDPNYWNENFDTRMGQAVALSDIPTSSSNYRRPRTVAAGYDYNKETDKGTITVVFRDGTFWNYYEVPSSDWIKFHNAFTKGPMLNKKSSKQGMDGTLLSYANGPADVSQLSPTSQEFLYKVVRTAQIYHRDQSPRKDFATKGTGQNTRGKRARNLNKAYDRASLAKAQRKLGKNPNQK